MKKTKTNITKCNIKNEISLIKGDNFEGNVTAEIEISGINILK